MLTVAGGLVSVLVDVKPMLVVWGPVKTTEKSGRPEQVGLEPELVALTRLEILGAQVVVFGLAVNDQLQV